MKTKHENTYAIINLTVERVRKGGKRRKTIKARITCHSPIR